MSGVQGEACCLGDHGVSEGISEEPHHKVVTFALAQPAILEGILRYVVLDEKRHRCIDNIHSVRLVQKNWLSAVSTVLDKYQKPLYKLTLNEENSWSESAVVKAEGKLLDRFVKFYTGHQITPVPTFRLNIEQDFFDPENYRSFYRCLRKCGQGLQKLKLEISQYNIEGINCKVLATVLLPKLKKLEFSLIPGGELAELFRFDELYNLDYDILVVRLMKTLLSKANHLSSLRIDSDLWTPIRINSLRLPSSLNQLYMKIDMEYNQLEMLTRSELQNLSRLTLKSDDYINAVLLNQILQNIRTTLKVLTILPGDLNPPRCRCLVKFPVMERLERLELFHNHVELDSKSLPLATSFPIVDTIELSCQTSRMLQKWTANGALPLVTTLSLHHIEESEHESDGNSKPLSMELMKGINQTFQNVTDLFMFTCRDDKVALKYIFKEMRRLTKLALLFVERQTPLLQMNNNSDELDAVFVGIPEESCASLKACPDLWNKPEFRNENEPSISMLSELQLLRLAWAGDGNGSHGVCNNESEPPGMIPMMSDLTYVHGLLKMPKLTVLQLGYGFRISTAILDKWNEEKGVVLFWNVPK